MFLDEDKEGVFDLICEECFFFLVVVWNVGDEEWENFGVMINGLFDFIS